MNIDNIELIINSPLFKRIKRNKYYINYYILDTLYTKQRKSGQFFCLLIFFKYKITNFTLGKYHKEGKVMSTNESLDPNQDISLYGMKILKFS